MIPAAFDYHAPGSLAEAIELLGKYGDAKVLSGGQSLLPLLKLRMCSVQHLVDINRVPGLEYIREEGGFLRIGGRTRESALEESDLIRKKYPILSDTARVIADPIVRNLATIGGNLAHGDPANDHPATMLAVRAVVVATGKKGERTIPVDAFFTGLFETALAKDEILTEIRIPMPEARSGGAYMKLVLRAVVPAARAADGGDELVAVRAGDIAALASRADVAPSTDAETLRAHHDIAARIHDGGPSLPSGSSGTIRAR